MNVLSDFQTNLQNLKPCQRTFKYFLDLSKVPSQADDSWMPYINISYCKKGHYVRRVNDSSIVYIVVAAENFTITSVNEDEITLLNPLGSLSNWEYDAREKIFNDITPCIQYDSGRARKNNTVNINMLSLIDPSNPQEALAYTVSVSKLNALNNNSGFEIGYKTKETSTYFAHTRLLLVQVGSPTDVSAYRIMHSKVLKYLLNSSLSNFNFSFVPGTGGPNNDIEREIIMQHKIINFMHSGPDYFYTETNNPYLFGIHLSSYRYSFPALKYFQQLGAKTIAVAGRSKSRFFDTTCDEALKYAHKLGIKSAMDRIRYDPDEDHDGDTIPNKIDRDFLKNITKKVCDSAADVYLLCIHHEDAKIMIEQWRDMEICQPKALWMTCTTWSAEKIRSSDNYNYAFGAGQWHPNMVYGDEFFDNGQSIIDYIKKSYDVETGYGAVAGYVVPYVISKLVTRIFQNKNLVGDSDYLEETYLSRANIDNYEYMRRQLETLIVTTSVFGPITFDPNRRNNGRMPSASQILPPKKDNLENSIINAPFLDTCVAPIEIAIEPMVYPCPGKAKLCDANSVYSMKKMDPQTCFLCEQCHQCPIYRGAPMCLEDIPRLIQNQDGSARCLKDFPAAPNRKKTIYYATDQWASADILNKCVAIILNEILGYNVEVVDSKAIRKLGIYGMLSALDLDHGQGAYDFHMELWAQGSTYSKFVLEKQSVLHVHDTGFDGVEGWYMNTPALKVSSKPLDLFRAYKNREVLNLMNQAGSTKQEGCVVSPEAPAYQKLKAHCNPETGIWSPPSCKGDLTHCPEFLFNDVGYNSVNVVLSQIKQLGLNFSMVFHDNWTDWRRSIMESKTLSVMYGWEPDPFFSTVPVARIQLPPYSTARWNNPNGPTCDWKPVTVWVAQNAKLSKEPWFQDAASLINEIRFSKNDMTQLMNSLHFYGGYISPKLPKLHAAACKWLNENTDRWSNMAVDTRKPLLVVGLQSNDLVASLATEIFALIARKILKYKVEVKLLKSQATSTILRQISVGLVDIALHVDSTGHKLMYDEYILKTRSVVQLDSLKLPVSRNIYMAFDRSKSDPATASALIVEHYLGFMEKSVTNLLPTLNTMGRDGKWINQTSRKLIFDRSTLKFLNDEGQFIPNQCKLQGVTCVEIYATNPYATFRLGFVEEILENTKTITGKKFKVALTYAREDAIDKIIKERTSQGLLVAYVSCDGCPLFLKNRAISTAMKFADRNTECDGAIDVQILPDSRSVGTYACGFGVSLSKKLISPAFGKKGKSPLYLADKFRFIKSMFRKKHFFDYLGDLKIVGGTVSSINEAALIFFEDYKDIINREFILSCETEPGKSGVYGLCEDCEPGKFSTDTMKECRRCNPGYYQPERGRSTCVKANPGSYVPDYGSINTMRCPKNAISTYDEETKSVFVSCECSAGYVMLQGNNITACRSCPEGSKCYMRDSQETGRTFDNIQSAPGYWCNKSFYKNDQFSLQFWRCSKPKDGRACPEFRNESSDCVKGHTGPLCELCEDGFAMSYIGVCERCSGGSDAAAAQLVVLGLLMLGIFVMVFLKRDALIKFVMKAYNNERLSAKQSPHRRNKQKMEKRFSHITMNRSTTQGDSLGMKLKILLAYFQILSSMANINSIRWSPAFNTLSSLLSFVDFDISSLHMVSCATNSNYLTKVLLITIWPIVASMCMFGYFLRATKCFSKTDRGIKRTEGFIKKSVILVILVLYPSISRVILKGFECISFTSTEIYLRTDLNISCSDPSYYIIMYFASFMTLVYPIGIPVTIFLYLRYQHKNGRLYLKGSTRDKILPTEAGMEQYGTLYLGYEPNFYWWEAFDMFRRFCLTSLIPIICPGEMLQIIVGILIIFSFLQAQAVAEPYLSDYDDILQSICQLSLFFMLFFGLIIAASSHDVLFWNRVGPNSFLDTSIWHALAFITALIGVMSCVASIVLWCKPQLREKILCYKKKPANENALKSIEMTDSGENKQVKNPLFKKSKETYGSAKPKQMKQSKRLSVKRHSKTTNVNNLV